MYLLSVRTSGKRRIFEKPFELKIGKGRFENLPYDRCEMTVRGKRGFRSLSKSLYNGKLSRIMKDVTVLSDSVKKCPAYPAFRGRSGDTDRLIKEIFVYRLKLLLGNEVSRRTGLICGRFDGGCIEALNAVMRSAKEVRVVTEDADTDGICADIVRKNGAAVTVSRSLADMYGCDTAVVMNGDAQAALSLSDGKRKVIFGPFAHDKAIDRNGGIITLRPKDEPFTASGCEVDIFDFLHGIMRCFPEFTVRDAARYFSFD